MWLSYALLTLILTAGVVYSIWARKLTVIAALTGAAVAILVFAGAGFTGIAMMTTFFILGSAATSVQSKVKQDLNAAEKGGRTAAQVLANAGTAALCGILILIFPMDAYILRLMMAASFASATADTLSSELGMVYGKRFFNIITLKPDTRGLDGVISTEGTLIGLCGSVIITAVYTIGLGWTADLIWIVVAGTLGNLADSVLGAVLERKGLIKNNAVNFLNTLIAALFMLLFYFIL
ncbi:TIGR00297 family protein [Mucilaginibacter angelicae]|uniref:TIGR00297 family protein n=1 Tax=Mucilaginibacter angelicae TaxID=869718 RepID=A0ABV6LBT8_9SPHI